MKIAVLVPVYNAEPFLRECLDSLLAQDGVDVFCLDDGSTDGSARILAEYAAATPRVRAASRPNAGVCAARNALLDALPPEYDAFAFCDSDDWVKPGMYAALAGAMERTGADVAESGWDGGAERFVGDMDLYWLRRTAPGAWINVINKLYRRSAAGAVRFRQGLAFEEDFFFNREVNAAVRSKVLVPGSYYVYRDNPQSATHVLDMRKYVSSALLRLRLDCETFLAAGRVPARIEGAFRAELAADAYRMCIRKTARKCRDAALRRDLLLEAGVGLAALEREFGVSPAPLGLARRLAWRACAAGRWRTALALAAAF